jgi:hypothetical protein
MSEVHIDGNLAMTAKHLPKCARKPQHLYFHNLNQIDVKFRCAISCILLVNQIDDQNHKCSSNTLRGIILVQVVKI